MSSAPQRPARIADQTVYVLEANPRATHRPVRQRDRSTSPGGPPSRARDELASLGLPPEFKGTGSGYHVKAAVLPFARFPGADPVLGPEMRSTGEVMATASDLPTAFAKAERAAGRPLPTCGAAFLSVRDGDKPSIAAIAAARAGLGFELVATSGTARTLRAAGLQVEEVGKVADAEPGEPTVVDLIREHRCDLVVNTPQGSGARADGRTSAVRPLRCRPRAVHHDDLRGRRGRPRDREREGGSDPVPAGAHRGRRVTTLVCDHRERG